VVAVALLPVCDVLGRRRPDLRALGLGGLAVLLVVPLHVFVGHGVGMMAELPGGSRISAVMTMGEVWLRYLGALLWPPSLSLIHDVPIRTSWDRVSLLGYTALLGWLALGLGLLWRRRSPMVLSTLALFIVPLIPVSQILYPLQNRMADRYLWLSVFAIALVVATLASRFPKYGLLGAALVCGGLAGFSAHRATLFGDPVLAFTDATDKTRLSPVAPYQLGQAYEAAGDFDRARAAYQAVLARDPGSEAGRRATNNWARLESRRGRWDLAEAILRDGLSRFPRDAKMVDNLDRTVRRRAEQASPERRQGL
jgi:hypothetical protein